MNRSLLLLASLVLAGCQTQPASNPPPSRPVPATAPGSALPMPSRFNSDPALERKIRQQAQFIESLISQNEALSTRLNEAPLEKENARVSQAGTPVVPPISPPAATPEPPLLVPNADNLIDLAIAVVTPKSGEAENPFAVRRLSPESTREVTLRVSGVVAGPTACAVVNDRLVQVGDVIESLAIERIDSDALLLKSHGHRLRVPVGVSLVRVRLPL